MFFNCGFGINVFYGIRKNRRHWRTNAKRIESMRKIRSINGCGDNTKIVKDVDSELEAFEDISCELLKNIWNRMQDDQD